MILAGGGEELGHLPVHGKQPAQLMKRPDICADSSLGGTWSSTQCLKNQARFQQAQLMKRPDICADSSLGGTWSSTVLVIQPLRAVCVQAKLQQEDSGSSGVGPARARSRDDGPYAAEGSGLLQQVASEQERMRDAFTQEVIAARQAREDALLELRQVRVRFFSYPGISPVILWIPWMAGYKSSLRGRAAGAAASAGAVFFLSRNINP